MIAGTTLRVLWTGEELTDGGAAENTQGVWATHLILTALIICGTRGHGGNLTLPSHRVSDVGGGALADRSVVFHRADLILSTRHYSAGINAAALAADVDAANASCWAIILSFAGHLPHAATAQIQRVARVAVLTDTGAVVVVSHTPGIWSALHISARIDTPVLTLH